MEQVHQIKMEKGRTRWLKVLGALVIAFAMYESHPPHPHLFLITPATVHVFECVFHRF